MTSIDGISAYDTISRRAMIAGLERVPGGSAASRFVRLFHSEPSAYLWEDAEGVVRTIHQGGGGEQGDPLMPLLFSVGQHGALSAIHEGMRVMSDCLLTWTTSGWCPSPIGLAICTILLNGSCGVGQGSGSIPARHMSGTDPAGSPQLAMSCRGEPKCWMKKHVCGQGQRFLPSNRASRCWGALWVTWISCGRSWRAPPRNTVHDFKQSRACPTSSQHGCCCSIPLRHEQTTNLRVLRLDVVEQFARTHDARVSQCLCDTLQIPEDFVGILHKEAATLPLSLGGLGLRSAVRTSVPPIGQGGRTSCP